MILYGGLLLHWLVLQFDGSLRPPRDNGVPQKLSKSIATGGVAVMTSSPLAGSCSSPQHSKAATEAMLLAEEEGTLLGASATFLEDLAHQADDSSTESSFHRYAANEEAMAAAPVPQKKKNQRDQVRQLVRVEIRRVRLWRRVVLLLVRVVFCIVLPSLVVRRSAHGALCWMDRK